MLCLFLDQNKDYRPEDGFPASFSNANELLTFISLFQSHLQASQALEAGLRHMASGFRNSYDETMSVLSPLNKSSAEVSK
jgi:hypothetical protein